MQTSRQRAAVTRKRAPYYLPKRQRYAVGESTFPSWHWPAFICAGMCWALYRKCWAGVLVYVVAGLLVAFAGAALAEAVGAAMDSSVLNGIVSLVTLSFSWACPGTVANYIYYRKARKLIAEARAQSRNLNVQVAYLAGKGETSWWPVVAVLVVSALSGVLAAIAVPQYAEYKVRAKVNEARPALRPLQLQVEDGVQWMGRVRELDYAPVKLLPGSKHIADVSIDDDAQLTVTLAIDELSGNRIRLRPYKVGTRIAWACENIDVPPNFLPVMCRGTP